MHDACPGGANDDPPLWGPNGVKHEALEQTQSLFAQLVAFYVPVLIRERRLWGKVPKRDKETMQVLFDSETGEIKMRAATADEVLTRVEAITVKTKAHPDPPYDLGTVSGAANVPVVFRRAAIKRAIGLVKAYRTWPAGSAGGEGAGCREFPPLSASLSRSTRAWA
jgi:putative transposase